MDESAIGVKKVSLFDKLMLKLIVAKFYLCNDFYL